MPDELGEVKQDRAASPLVRQAVREGRSALDEGEAKALLAAYGVPTPLGKVVHTAQEAAQAVEALGTRCVLKGVGADVQHKSDNALIEPDVRDAAAARRAYHRIHDRGAGRVTGVLVEEWVPHERELLVGMRRDPQFGPVFALGIGGIFTEAVADVSFALPPVDGQVVREMVAGLRTAKMLGVLRGLPAVDLSQLETIIAAVARMTADNPPIAEIDVNPLLVAGGQLIAADALVVLEGEDVARAGGERAAAPARDRHDLDAVFAPASVAVVGASDDVAKWGGSVMRNLIDGGFAGRLYPVNPKAPQIFGLPAYPSLDELPETPDLAVVALAGAHAARVVADCGRRGVRAAVVIAAGFAETGSEGAALQDELVRVARGGGVTLVGPNCMGVLCTSSRLNAVGFVTLRPERGPISVVSQSGNIGSQLLMTAERQAIGIEKFVSSGNQATTDATDLLQYLADDPATGVVVLYLEGVADGRRLFDVARAVTPRKPVILVRGGRSRGGRRAALSHTGALAGSGRVFAAAARQARIITADEPDEALDVAALLAYQPRLRGPRVAIVSLGGGWGVLTADAVEEQGLELAQLSPATVAAVDELLPPFWSRGNPVDLVTTVTGGVPEKVVDLVAGAGEVDAVITLALIGSPSSGRSRGEDGAAGLNERELDLLQHFATVMERTGKPVVSVPLSPVRRTVYPGMGSFAPVLLRTPGAAVRALARAAWYARRAPGDAGGPSRLRAT
jgi:acyl-CoA synthetase (NDP forming)